MAAGLLCAINLSSQAQARMLPPVAYVEPVEKWRTVFAGGECVYHFNVSARENVEGRAAWSFICANRTIARGESSFKAGPEEKGKVEVRFNLPPVNEGVIVTGQLTVALYERGQNEALESREMTLQVFPGDSFSLRKEWLKKLDIGLYDPHKKTQSAFQELGIPFKTQDNPEALEDFKGALLVIGSGIDFASHPALWRKIVNISASGVPVLVLAPAGGSVELPGAEGVELPEPASAVLARKSIIRELDEKLDADAWAPDGTIVTSSMLMIPERGRVLVKFVPGEKGWSWLEVGFTGKGARVVVCGFGIVENMSASPTPRFLLARLFEYLTRGRT